MKKLLKKRFLGIPIGIIAVVLLATSVALAAYFTVAIPSHVTITPAPPPLTYTIGVYEDAECTILYNDANKIEWGSLEAGTVAEQIVYIKNQGTAPVAVTVSTDVSSALVTLGASPSPLNLAVGTSGACTLSLTAGANPSDFTFSIDFDSNP